jgi:transketolase
VRTVIGYGLPTKEGTDKAHGEPPGEDELRNAKLDLGWPLEPSFYVPPETLEFYREVGKRGQELEAAWNELFADYRREDPDLGKELERRLKGELPADWAQNLPTFPADKKGMATRVASGKAINALAPRLPELMGGSADLAPSNKTWINGSPSFQPETPEGRNMHFGVREHAMGAIINGMSVNGGIIPYSGTFLVFSDYMRPAIRLAALSEYPSIFVFTHDSIGLGEDGPTHQPIEQLASLRAMPEMVVIRPADANEVIEAWKVAIERRHGPTALALTRQNVPTLDRNVYAPASGLRKGAYVLADLGNAKPELILMATGSEVGLITEAGARLAAEGMNLRLVSFPSWELFASQDVDYQNSVLTPSVTARLAVEAGVTMGWERWTGCKGKTLGIDRYGASAPYQVIYQQLGLTVDHIVEMAHSLLGR